MTLKQAGIDLIKSFEKCRLSSYPDPATGDEPWTIGWGATGPDIDAGMVWTQAEADARLVADLKDVSDAVSRAIIDGLNDNQFSAIVSLVYNIGISKFRTSTMLALIHKGDLDGAANEFPKWDRAAGQANAGLLRRRLAEQRLFLK